MMQQKKILDSLPNVLKDITISSLGKRAQGKVRDIYIHNGERVLITTDRQSAFDVMLGHIPYKGTVLNLLSEFWFKKTKKIIRNHMIAVPDPNVMITENCDMVPVEMVVRGYISGVTKTSIWYSYQQGERLIYGIKFPDGLKKNDRLPNPVITPTTHGGGKGGHDDRLTKEEIVKKKLVDKKLYEQMEKISLRLFKFGSALCKKRGLILVDTKYEFGLHNGKLILIDEIHTPDSSRFWIKKTYKSRVRKGLEPENFDKEFIRLWYAERGYRGDGPPQKMSQQLIIDTSKRYIGIYEKLTNQKFIGYNYPIQNRVLKNIDDYFEKQNRNLQTNKKDRKRQSHKSSKKTS